MVRVRPVVSLLLLLLLSPFADAASTVNVVRRRAVRVPTMPPVIDAAAKRALDAGVPGLTIAVVFRGETIVRAYGFSDREAGVAARETDIYQIGSVTKQFTAAAIMRLVEQGKVSLDDKVSKYVPEILPLDATLSQLLTHTSGINDYFTKLTENKPMTNAEVIAFIKSLGTLFPAGRSWSYSNSGYYLLGMVIERVTGRAYADVLDEWFFTPLQLRSTSYCGTKSPTPSGYIAIAGQPVVRTVPADMSLAFAAGAICSTAYDLTRWSRDLEMGLVVSPQSYAAMTTPVRLTSGATVPYGFGLALTPTAGHRSVWHDGSILGYTSDLARLPDDDLTIAVLLNATTLDSLAVDVTNDIALKLVNP
jgi:D-alanyl-D-alanine carboxypeptidase